MILHTMYAKKNFYSIMSKFTRSPYLSENKRDLLNMTSTKYKFSPHSNNKFFFMEKEVLFIVNHGGGIPTVLIKPKPLIQNSFAERRLTIETYSNIIKNSFSLNLYENKKIILMAVCFAAKKPTFGNDILAVELAKKLKIHVIAADSIVSVSAMISNEYLRYRNGERIAEQKNYIRDISTYGNWYLIDPQGKMQLISIVPEKMPVTQNHSTFRIF